MHVFRIVAFALALSVSACTRGFGVDIVGTISDSVISAYIPGGLFDLGKTPTRVREVEVRDWTFLAEHPGALQPQPTLWHTEGTCDAAPPLVHYGTNPAGFIEKTPPQALREGRTYMVSADGCEPGYISGIMTFRITHGRITEIAWH